MEGLASLRCLQHELDFDCFVGKLNTAAFSPVENSGVQKCGYITVH